MRKKYTKLNKDPHDNIKRDLKKPTNKYCTQGTKSGVRQGGMEGHPLYNVFSDYAQRVYDDRKEEANIPGLSIPYLIPNEATDRAQKSRAPASGIYEDPESAYADDFGAFSWNLEDLNIIINILAQVFKEFGLNINLMKTETIVFGQQHSNNDEDYPTSILKINGTDVWLESVGMSIGKSKRGPRKFLVGGAVLGWRGAL